MTIIDMICCYYMLKQLMYDIWYLTLTYKVYRYNRKDHSKRK
jgi:hypothetical protein